VISSPNICLIIARVSVTFFLPTFPQNLVHNRRSFVRSIAKQIQNPNSNKGRKNQHIHPAASNYFTQTLKTVWYYHLPLHRATTTAVQIEASVPEIMDTSSYAWEKEKSHKSVLRPRVESDDCTKQSCHVAVVPPGKQPLHLSITTYKQQTPWSESASELYRPSDHSLSAKLVPTFADRGCHVVSVTDAYGRILAFLNRNR
jgi:hypothetical protein